MPRLPQPGGDTGNWGQILNDYLSQAHNPNGSLKDNIITTSNLSQTVQDKLNTVAGQQGATGPIGPAGPTGATGATGASGTPGTQGATGATGAPSTVPGPTGATGPQGPQGEPGPAATIGATGPSGPTGATGASGAPGLQGATGTSGPAGATGATGAQGPSGSSGSAGASGATGATGAIGPGVPTGGTTGQILAKTSNANYDTGWIAAPSGGGGGPITIADLPAGSVLFARYNTGTSTWPARPTARTDIMVHWIGASESTPPPEAVNGVDLWDWNGS